MAPPSSSRRRGVVPLSIFMSKHAGLTVPVLEPQMFVDPQTGQREQLRGPIYADFADTSVSGTVTDGDGNVHQDIRGGCFDTDDAAERLGWTEQEKAAVESKLLRLAADPREPVTLWVAPVPVAPWPNYDATHHFKLPGLAEELGLLSPALDYERATKNRDSVVQGYEEKLADELPADALTAA